MMAVFQKACLTQYGLERVANAHINEKMVFTAIGLGDQFLTGSLNEATDLTGEKQRFPIVESKVSGNNFQAVCKPTDIDDPEGIYVRSMGLYIADPDHEGDRGYDRLYSVSSVIGSYGSEPDYFAYLPSDPVNAVVDYKFAMHTIIAPAALVQIIHSVGGIGIATDVIPGLIKSGSGAGEVSVDQVTGCATLNGFDESIERLELVEKYLSGDLPNPNRDIGTQVEYKYVPSPLTLAKKRHLPMLYQIIEIALYQDLCDLMWCGEEDNDTALWWYRCDEYGGRDAEGQYMRVEASQGVFTRGAGANPILCGADDTPYDGGCTGDVQGDAMRNLTGYATMYAEMVVGDSTGVFSMMQHSTSSVYGTGTSRHNGILNFNAASLVPTGSEFKPASVSNYVCITY